MRINTGVAIGRHGITTRHRNAEVAGTQNVHPGVSKTPDQSKPVVGRNSKPAGSEVQIIHLDEAHRDPAYKEFLTKMAKGVDWVQVYAMPSSPTDRQCRLSRQMQDTAPQDDAYIVLSVYPCGREVCLRLTDRVSPENACGMRVLRGSVEQYQSFVPSS